MTADELMFTLVHLEAVRDVLYKQLQEVQDIDPDLARLVLTRLDQVCGINARILDLQPDQRQFIQDYYFSPPGSRPPGSASIAGMMKALKALQDLVNSYQWDSSYYEAWRVALRDT